jgi:hypothetical protein
VILHSMVLVYISCSLVCILVPSSVKSRRILKPDSHMSPTSAMPLFEISEEEHRQKILILINVNDQRQWASPTSATYENQA